MNVSSIPSLSNGPGVPLFGASAEVSVHRGLADFKAGRPVIVAAGTERLLVLPVDGATPESISAFRAMVRPALPQLAITASRARVLGIETDEPIRVALEPRDDLRSIERMTQAVRATPRSASIAGGLAVTAAIDLAKLAERVPALLVAEASLLSRPELQDLITIDAAALVQFRRKLVDSLVMVAQAQVPLLDGIPARFHVFRDSAGGTPVAVVVGAPDFSRPVPVRLHSACLTGDVFGSRRCDCGAQLQLAIGRLHELGGGIVLYLEQEGRGVGLANKMRAYALQDQGLDTVDANTTLGFDDDERDYGIAARILKMIGCTRLLLLTNNPGKLEALAEAGVEIAGRIPLQAPINADNRRYLTAKAARAGHWLEAILAHSGDEDRDLASPPPV
jgi:GTP cyclohydrolase II